jgi:hypothetical protein
MCQDRIVIDYLTDLAIAEEFYSALCNVNWYIKRSPEPEEDLIIRKLKGERDGYWTCSWRTAGGYIAEIRNTHHDKKEDYMDFYCSGNEGIISDLVRECFDRMGWTPVED